MGQAPFTDGSRHGIVKHKEFKDLRSHFRSAHFPKHVFPSERLVGSAL